MTIRGNARPLDQGTGALVTCFVRGVLPVLAEDIGQPLYCSTT